MARTLAGVWESYAFEVMPANAGDVQRRETRLAFYAGAGAMLGLAMEAIPDDESDEKGIEQAMAVLDALSQELSRFKVDVMLGKI